MLSLCEATVDPRAERSANSTVAPPTVKTTSTECGSVPLLLQQGRDGRDGRDGLPGPAGPSGTKGEKGDPGIVAQGAAGPKGMYETQPLERETVCVGLHRGLLSQKIRMYVAQHHLVRDTGKKALFMFSI